MGGYKTFGEYLEQRDEANTAAPQWSRPDTGRLDPAAGSCLPCDLAQPDAAADEGQAGARSIFGNLFKSPFKPVNPARAVSPTNSRLLASPFRKQRLRSQVVGK